ncbi:response regulator [Sinomicrobium sp. FJxs]|uniref:histidine kinase n=2 Tax=Sinomicrobium weinanense TaxID=2842200 RepID=A0A926Q5A6_9FLAO|nr:response regulator [Sinomicrobium weinanense]
MRYFRGVSVDDGLSQSTVFSIVQGALGFIWMGTQDGLNRYDGRSVTTYRPVSGDPRSLRSAYIRSAFKDSRDRLWIGGDKGVSRYDYSSDDFTNFPLPYKSGEWYISSITEDKNGVLWAGSNSGQIFYLEEGASDFTELKFDKVNLNIHRINTLLCMDDRLYIGADEGLFGYHFGTGTFTAIDLGRYKYMINDLLPEKDRLWIATEGGGLLCYRFRDKSVKQYLHQTGDPDSLADNTVRSIEKDDEGYLWVGSFRGLSILDVDEENFVNYYHSSTIPYTISQNSVRSVYRDKQGGMWLGTYYGGANYYHRNDIKFNLLNFNSGSAALNDQVVNVIKEDRKGNFWIGSNDKGLNYWDREKNRVKFYSHDEKVQGSLSSNNIKAIAFDDDENLLIGTHNAGLNYFNPITGKNIKYQHSSGDPESISGNMVYALLKDHKNKIWVGTRSGLDLFDPSRGTFTHFYLDRMGNRLTSDQITYMMEDSRNRIWIGTSRGVNIFYPDKMLFESLSGAEGEGILNKDVITCIAEDGRGRIWIGTRNGLKCYDEKNGFTVYDTSNGLPNNVIYGLLVDDEGLLWISTNKGLARFNPDTGQVQLFDHKDGLQSNQFNLYAFYKASDGMMLFGGINGLSYFYPESIRQEPLKLAITFTGLDIYNDRVNPENESPILNGHINEVKKVVFGPDQKQFTFYFNAFNYISPNKVTYQYKLDGYDQQWQTTEEIPRASYANLPAGTYYLQVRAVGPKGGQSAVRAIEVDIRPYWWNSNWFYITVAVVFVLGVYISYKVVTERLQTLHQLKIERIEREKSEAVNKMKMEFFTNVSHEFRTPLTLILAPVEEILNNSSVDKSVKKQLQLIMQNTKRLLFLVDQLMDFRKVELGSFRLNMTTSDLVGFTHDIYTSFAPLSNKKNLKYTYRTTEAELIATFDKDSVRKICFNLLSNAFKFTGEGGSVEFRLSRSEEGYAVIEVKDSGIGIAENLRERIFDRFYQVNGNETGLGSGIGLALTRHLVEEHRGFIEVESCPQKGSSFIVMLPLDHSDGVKDTANNRKPPKEEIKLLNEKNDAGMDDLVQEGDQREKLLIVEDNIEIVNYLEEYFLRYYAIVTASDGREALDIIDHVYVDIVVCDIMMPGMDGFLFCKKVKQNIKTSHIPVVLLTARKELDQQIEGFEVGADDYVTKPFSIRLLHAKIENIIRSRKRLRAYYAQNKEVVPENLAHNARDEEFLKEALRIVEENIAEPDFSVDEFSKKIGMSRSNLYLKFKAITGESATDFMKRIRFNKAVKLIETQKYTTAQVAYMSGFNSPSYFSTSFKQYFGYIPTKHMELQHNNRDENNEISPSEREGEPLP